MKLISTLLIMSIFIGTLNTPASAGPRGFTGGNKPVARPAPRPSAPAISGHMPTARPNIPAARPNVPAARPNIPAARPNVPAARPNVPVTRPQPITRPSPPARPVPQPAKPAPLPTTRPSLVPKPTPLPNPGLTRPTPMPTPKTTLPKTTLPKTPTPTPRPTPLPMPKPVIPERPKINLPERPKTLPGNPKIDPKPMPKVPLPERPKINLPERPTPMPKTPMPKTPTPKLPERPAVTLPNRPNRPERPIIGGGNNNGNNNNNTWINNRPIINNGGNTTNNINNININNNYWNSYRPNYNQPWGGWHNGYWHGYYGGWHSNWHGGYSNFWNNAAWFSAGVATGWLFAPRVASYTYVNPFYIAPATPTTIIYDYSQPIVTAPVAPQPAASSTDVPVNLNVTISPTIVNEKPSPQEKAAPEITKLTEDEATQLKETIDGTLEVARKSFKEKKYDQALKEIDAAIKKIPNDPALHELRALILFAQKNYKESSAAIYSVLASGPGWNWETLSGLYTDVTDFSTQLKDLEAHYKANPKASEDAFLLAYHYMTLEEKDAAIAMLEDVQELIPGDELSKRMMNFLKNPPKPPAETPDKPKPGS